MRNYVRFKFARVHFHARAVTPGHFDYDDYQSTIVMGEDEDEDNDQVANFLRMHTDQVNYEITLTSVEFVKTWWLTEKKHIFKLIVDSIQKTYIYDLELFLSEGQNAWEGLRRRSPRKKGRKG